MWITLRSFVPTWWPRPANEPHRLPATLVDMLAVLDQASRIDPDRGRVYRWYADDPIAELGDRTAADMVRSGETSRLLALLREIEAAERSARHVGQE